VRLGTVKLPRSIPTLASSLTLPSHGSRLKTAQAGIFAIGVRFAMEPVGKIAIFAHILFWKLVACFRLILAIARN
jgi:hypothetical protein